MRSYSVLEDEFGNIQIRKKPYYSFIELFVVICFTVLFYRILIPNFNKDDYLYFLLFIFPIIALIKAIVNRSKNKSFKLLLKKKEKLISIKLNSYSFNDIDFFEISYKGRINANQVLLSMVLKSGFKIEALREDSLNKKQVREIAIKLSNASDKKLKESNEIF
jgi:hypothetical protein